MSSSLGGALWQAPDVTQAPRSGLAPARLPFPVVAPHRVVPAPRPVQGSPAVEVDDAWPAALRRRVQRLTEDRDGVVVHDDAVAVLGQPLHPAS